MSKYVLIAVVCTCLFVISFSVPGAAQSYPRDWWTYSEPMWNWGPANDDIPEPDFSPLRSSGENEGDMAGDMAGVVILDGLDLSGRDLRNVQSNVLGGMFRNVKFDNANLEAADFTDTILINCSFRGANMRHARIQFNNTCDLTDAILGGQMEHLTAEQMQSTWNFKNKDFSNTFWLGCGFPDIEYDSSFNFTNALNIGLTPDQLKLEDFRWNQLPIFGESSLQAHHAFRIHDFRQKSLHGLTVRGIDFSNRDFSGFTLGLFERCDFQDANFKDAMRLNIPVVNADTFMKFGFVECRITKEQIEQTRFWKENNIRHIVLERMDLSGWDFSNKDLRNASLKQSFVKDANFENALLSNTDISFPLIYGRIKFRDYTQPDTKFKFTIEQLKQTRSWKERRILGCTFQGVNFDNCDLSGVNFGGTTFIDCSFENANVSDAIISIQYGRLINCTGITEEQVRSLWGFEEKWLHMLPKE